MLLSLERRSEIAGRIMNIKTMVKELQSSQDMSRTRDQIVKQQSLRQELKEVYSNFKEMEHLYQKEQKKRRSKQALLSRRLPRPPAPLPARQREAAAVC